MSGLLSCLVSILHMLILLSCNKSFRLILIPAINKFRKGLFSLSFVKKKTSRYGEIIMLFNDKGNSCTCCESLTSYICLFKFSKNHNLQYLIKHYCHKPLQRILYFYNKSIVMDYLFQ